MKILYFDVETTGLDPKEDHITQLSGLIEIDGEVVEEFNFYLRPPDGTTISKKALEVTGKTIDEIREYPDAFEGYEKFVDMLGKYVNQYDPYDPATMFYPCAYNGNFDLQFLQQLFLRNGNKYFYKYQNWQLIDPLVIFRTLSFCGLIDVANHKLGTLCNCFDIEIFEHDALSDVKATRQLLYLLKNGLEFKRLGVTS